MYKERLLNAVTVDLIEKMDCVPARDENNRYILNKAYRIFEKRDLINYSLIQLVDGETVDVQSMDSLMKKNSDYLENMNSSHVERFEIISVAVFTSTSANNVLDILKRYSVIRGLSIIIVDMALKAVYPFRETAMSQTVNAIIAGRLNESLDMYDTLPDINKLVNREKPVSDIPEAAKTSPAKYHTYPGFH